MSSETVIINSTKGGKKKKLKKQTLNKQVSTNDPFDEELKEDKSISIDRPISDNRKISNLEKLKKKTEEYNMKLDKIDKQIINEKNSVIKELNEINNDLEEKENDIKKLTEDNKILFSELKNIKDEVDDKMKLVRIFKLKEVEMLKNEEKLNKEIKVKEKEIIITTRNIETYQKEKENLDKIIKKNGDNKQYSLNLKLHSLALEKEILEKEIKDDKASMNEHKFCENKKHKLQNKLNILRNELEFEKKKLNMENEKKKENLQTTTTPIWKELEIAHQKYLKSISNMSARKIFENNQQDERSKFGLFSPKEVEILSKLIPNDFLEVYQQRYNNVESQKQEIEEQLLYGNIDKKQEIKDNKQRIDKSNLQIKEQNFKNGKLNEDISKLKKLGNEINGEIKTVNEHLKNIQMVLNTKLRENERLREKLNDIQNKIKNGELILKNPEENKDINEDEENEEEEENENNNNNESDNEEEDEI